MLGVSLSTAIVVCAPACPGVPDVVTPVVNCVVLAYVVIKS